MMELKLVLAFLLSIVVPLHAGHGSWDYLKKGPSTWGANCKGKSQSPINIDLSQATRGVKMDLLFNHNYWNDASGLYTIKNNGHALQIDLPKNTKYQLVKGDQKYVPLQIHIHFDPVTGKGSEHTLNNKKYFAEIHMVHRNAKYTAKKDIMGNDDGLMVLGMFVDKVKDVGKANWDMDYSFSNLMMKTPTFNNHVSFIMQVFRDGAVNLKKAGQKKFIPAFPLAWVLPRVPTGNDIDYVNYKGSLTTPPCSEIVDWVVVTGRVLEINEVAAKDFVDVKNSGKTKMAGNNRPVQAVNGRTIYAVEQEMKQQ